MNINSSPMRRIYATQENAAGISIPTAGNTDIIELDVSQLARLSIEIRNTGANAFDAFVVQGKTNPAGAFVTLLSAATDYSTPAGIVVDASGDLTILAGGATGWLILDVLGFDKLKLQASANDTAGATTARAFVGGGG